MGCKRCFTSRQKKRPQNSKQSKSQRIRRLREKHQRTETESERFTIEIPGKSTFNFIATALITHCANRFGPSSAEGLLMEVTEGDFITTYREPKENLSHSSVPKIQDHCVPKIQDNCVPKIQDNCVSQIQDNCVPKIHDNSVPRIQYNSVPKIQCNSVPKIQVHSVPKIYTIIVQRSYPVVQQILFDSAVESTSKSKPVEDGVSKEGGVVSPSDGNTVDKSAHHVDDNVFRNRNENSVTLEISRGKSAKPSGIVKHENDESVIAFPNAPREDITVSQEHASSRKTQQHVNHTHEGKGAETSVISGCSLVTEGSMISQSTSKRKYDCNFIKNYWMAAFASNPEYGLYELPPQNGYCCPFCDFVGNDSSGVLIHWKQHFGEEQFSPDRQKKSVFSRRDIHNKLRQHKCHLCNKHFAKHRALQKHMVSHYSSEPFKCNICNKAFFLKTSLLSHIKVHSNSKHKCTHCEKTYTYEISLERHVRTVHQV